MNQIINKPNNTPTSITNLQMSLEELHLLAVVGEGGPVLRVQVLVLFLGLQDLLPGRTASHPTAA